MTYIASNIIYDTDGEIIDLPTTLEINVPDEIHELDEESIVDFISDEISNITGFCHLEFTFSKK